MARKRTKDLGDYKAARFWREDELKGLNVTSSRDLDLRDLARDVHGPSTWYSKALKAQLIYSIVTGTVPVQALDRAGMKPEDVDSTVVDMETGKVVKEGKTHHSELEILKDNKGGESKLKERLDAKDPSEVLLASLNELIEKKQEQFMENLQQGLRGIIEETVEQVLPKVLEQHPEIMESQIDEVSRKVREQMGSELEVIDSIRKAFGVQGKVNSN